MAASATHSSYEYVYYWNVKPVKKNNWEYKNNLFPIILLQLKQKNSYFFLQIKSYISLPWTQKLTNHETLKVLLARKVDFLKKKKRKKETKSLIRSSSKYDSLGFILGLRVRLKNKLLPLNFNSEETFYLLSVEELLIRSNLLALHNREWMNFEF